MFGRVRDTEDASGDWIKSAGFFSLEKVSRLKKLISAIWLLSIGVFVSGLGAQSSSAENLLAAGDRISLKVIGLPDLETEIAVSPEGTIRLPLIGHVTAAGRTIIALQTEIASELSRAPFQVKSDTGTVWIQVDETKVFVAVAEFRPVYVSGDVQTVGALAFRPGMTVRQARTSAGGIFKLPPENNTAELTKTLTEHMLVAQRLEHARRDVILLQIEHSNQSNTVLGDAENSSPKDLPPHEFQWLTTRAELRDLEARTTDLPLAKMEERLQVLAQMEGVNAAVLQNYEEESERINELAKRGIATANAVAEAERGILSLSSRVLEISAESLKLKVDMARLSAAAQAELAEARLGTLTQLMNKVARVQDLEAQLAVLDTKIAFFSPAKTTKQHSENLIFIYRRAGRETKRIDADLDTELFPGDVVEFHSTVLSD